MKIIILTYYNYPYIYQFQFYSIDNLALPMEAATNGEEQEKKRYINVPETISDNISLETVKILKILSQEALQKPRNQNGIPIVSDYFQKRYIKIYRIMERFTKIELIIIVICLIIL